MRDDHRISFGLISMQALHQGIPQQVLSTDFE
jgi:hypothetical protein